MRRELWTAMSILAMASSPRAAAAPALTRDGATGKLVVAGPIDEKQTSIEETLRLRLAGSKDPLPVRLEAHDLTGNTRRGELRKLSGRNITIPAGVNLDPTAATELRLTVTGLRDAATYEGDVLLVAGSGAARATLTVPIVVQSQTRPALTVAPFTMRTARCGAVGCAILRAFMPHLATGEGWPLEIRNSGDDEASVDSIRLWLTGERGAESVGERLELALPAMPATVAPGDALRVEVKPPPSDLPPDRYSGDVVVVAHGPAPTSYVASASARAEVSLRAGPMIPLLLIGCGILLGRLARGLDTPDAQAQVRLHAAWRRAREEVLALRDHRARLALLGAVRALELRIERNRLRSDPEEQVATAIDDVRRCSDAERLTERWEDVLGATRIAQLQPQVEAVRAAVMAVKPTDAEAAFAKLDDAARAALSSEAASTKMAGAQGRASALEALAPARPPPRDAEKRPRLFARAVSAVLGLLSGLTTPSAHWRYILQQAMFVLLLLLLGIIGFQTLYVSAGTTFGAGGVVDYLTLLLWGLSADVAQRTLQGLQLPKS